MEKNFTRGVNPAAIPPSLATTGPAASIGPIRVIIPALNEERAIAEVLKAIPAYAAEVIVVDNGSTDATAQVARSLGATVVSEPRRGYGAACLRGMAALPADTGIVVFLDGDFSDFPGEMDSLVGPIRNGGADLVIGSRVLGRREKGALLPVAIFGNWLTTRLVKLGWGFAYTDLGPFRAIGCAALLRLGMADRDFGWTIEMQVKAVNQGLRIAETPVSYRKRIGQSKISGTVLGSWRAGKKILYIVAREWLRKPRPARRAASQSLPVF
jgi:glycosyltransferase involved in cell wall biosynthesis